MLDTARDTDHVGRYARSCLLRIAELLVRRSPRVDSERLCVTDVGEVGDELEAVNDLGASLGTTLDAECEDTAESALEVLFGHLVRWMALETRVRNPCDVLVLLEPAGKREGVGGVSLATERESLETEEKLVGAKGVESWSEVTKNLDTNADSKSDRTESVPELETVVSLGGLDHLRETSAVLAPVKLARVDNHTSNSCAMAADPLGGRVDDNIGSVVDRAEKEAASTKGVVNLGSAVKEGVARLGSWRCTHNKGDASIVGDLCNGLKVGNVETGVTDSLDVNGLGLLVNGSSNVLGLVAVDKLGGDTKTGEEDLELVVGASVEVGSSDNVITDVGERGNSHKLRCLAGRRSDSGDTTLESSDTLLEYVHSWVHDTAVDVSKLLESEETGAVGRVIESE